MITKNGGAVMTIFAQTGQISWTFKDKSGTTFTVDGLRYGGIYMDKAETSQNRLLMITNSRRRSIYLV